MAPRLPLDGIRVLDFTVVWAGPFAAMTLADLGAEVIRVESIQHLDLNTRGMPKLPPVVMAGARGRYYPNKQAGEHPWNRTGMFNYAGRNKLSMTVDLTRKEGLDYFFKLVSVSDVLIDNNAAATLAKLGITYERLRKVRPDIVMLQFPNYGTTGPYRNYKGYGANVEAFVGHTWLRGYPDSDPSNTYIVYHADAAAAQTAAFAIMAALHHRSRTGQGQYIDLSQGEAMVHHLSQAVMDYSMNGRVQGSLGNRHPYLAPHGAYRCKGDPSPGSGQGDAWVAIAVRNDEEFSRLCKEMGWPELATDERFTTGLARLKHQDELDEAIGAWTATLDKDEVMRRLQRAGVPAGALLTPHGAFKDPHLRARGFFQTVTHPEAGTHEYASPFIRLSKTPLSIRRPAPCLGEHNHHLYRGLLGVDTETFANLRTEGHVGEVYAAVAGGEPKE